MLLAAEAGLGAMFLNTKEAILARNTLEEIDYPEPKMPMQVDNSTTIGMTISNIQPRRTKVMDMRFQWLRDWAVQEQFCLTPLSCPSSRDEEQISHSKEHIVGTTSVLTEKPSAVDRDQNSREERECNTSPTYVRTYRSTPGRLSAF